MPDVMLMPKPKQRLHRRIQGVHWVHVHPQGGEKNRGRNLQGKVVSAPQAESARVRRGRARVQFLRTVDLDSRRGYLGSFSVCFEGDD